MKQFFLSSTGEGVMLRLKSFLILGVPFLLNFIQVRYNYQFAPEPLVKFIDACFVILFGTIHAYAWLRSLKGNKLPINTKVIE
jgi:hypothetical protein